MRSLEVQVQELSAALDAAQHTASSNNGPTSAASPALSGLVKSSTAHSSPAGTEASAYPSSPIRAPRGAPAPSQEVHAINKATRNVEFYGSSSSVALLSQIHKGAGGSDSGHGGGSHHGGGPYGDNETGSETHSESEAAAAVLLSNLHNPSFSPGGLETGAGGGSEANAPGQGGAVGLEKQAAVSESTHYRQCSVFLHNFFSGIHYIHPILDKTSFLERSEVLWSGDEAAIKQQATFVPLYYSVLSLGALVGYRDTEPVCGISNQQWSRKFFNEARGKLPALEVVTSVDLVQCFFFLVSAALLLFCH